MRMRVPPTRSSTPHKRATGERGAAVVLRYGYDLTYDQIARGTRFEPGRGPPGRVVGCSPTAEREER